MSAPVCGIDPGLSGAIAYYDPAHPGVIIAEDLPVVGREVVGAILAKNLEIMRPQLVMIERAGTRPGQAAGATLRTGTNFGILVGVVSALRIPVAFVNPGVWKRYFHLPKDKEESRALALRKWPEQAQVFKRKMDEGRAEAALIAVYGAETALKLRAAA